MTMKASPHVRACLTSGASGVLLHVERDRLYSLDRTGTEIWRQFSAGLTPDAIAASIASTHGAPEPLVHGDVVKFLARLEQQGLVIRSAECTTIPSARALVTRCVWRLLRVDLDLRLRGFGHVYGAVARHRTRAVTYPEGIVAAVCRAMDRASTIYPRRALCLQRSAAAVCVLRDHGVAAALVIGARKHPFRAHAWVEAEGVVVNDKRGVKDYYVELDRF
jgi:hypothetical protein